MQDIKQLCAAAEAILEAKGCPVDGTHDLRVIAQEAIKDGHVSPHDLAELYMDARAEAGELGGA